MRMVQAHSKHRQIHAQAAQPQKVLHADAPQVLHADEEDEEHKQHEQHEQQHEQHEHRQHGVGEEQRSSEVVAAVAARVASVASLVVANEGYSYFLGPALSAPTDHMRVRTIDAHIHSAESGGVVSLVSHTLTHALAPTPNSDARTDVQNTDAPRPLSIRFTST